MLNLTGPRRVLIAMVIIGFCPALGALSQSGATSPESVLGTWRGESKCLVKPSGCNDEDSVYRVTAGSSAGKVRLAANRIVNGKEVNMGDSECNYAATTTSIDCPLPNGSALHLRAKGPVIDGTMTLGDGTLWRKLTLRKDTEK